MQVAERESGPPSNAVSHSEERERRKEKGQRWQSDEAKLSLAPFVPAGKVGGGNKGPQIQSTLAFLCLPQLRYRGDNNIIYETRVAGGSGDSQGHRDATAFGFGHGAVAVR